MDPVGVASGVAAVLVSVHSVVRYLCGATSSFRNISLELHSIDLQCGAIGIILSQIEGVLLEHTEKHGQRQDILMQELSITLRGCQQMFEKQLEKLKGYGICGDLNILDRKTRTRIKASLNKTELNSHQLRLKEQFQVLHSMLEVLRTSREHAYHRAWYSSRLHHESVHDLSFESQEVSCSRIITGAQQKPNIGIRSRLRRMCSSWSIGHSAASRPSSQTPTFVDHTRLGSSKPESTLDEYKSRSEVEVTAVANVQHEAQNGISRPATMRTSKSTPAMREYRNLALSDNPIVPAVPKLPAQYTRAKRTLVSSTITGDHQTGSSSEKKSKQTRTPLSERSTNTQFQRSNPRDDGQKAKTTTPSIGHRKAVSTYHLERMAPELAHLRQQKHSSVIAGISPAQLYTQDHRPETEHVTVTLTRVRSEMLLRKGSYLFESSNPTDSNGLKSPLQRLESYGRSVKAGS